MSINYYPLPFTHELQSNSLVSTCVIYGIQFNIKKKPTYVTIVYRTLMYF